MLLWGSPSPFFSHTKTSFSRPRTSHGSRGGLRLPQKNKPCVMQKPAWSQAGQGAVEVHRAFPDQGLSLVPQSPSSADPHLENQLTVE